MRVPAEERPCFPGCHGVTLSIPNSKPLNPMNTHPTSHKLICVATAAATVLLGNLALAQDHKGTPKAEKAVAILQSTSGSQVKGTVTFTKVGDGIRVEGEISGLTPGKHGFHVHEFGDTSSADGKSAGGHFNPAGEQHGAPDASAHHAGDLGNIEAGADGRSKFAFTDKTLTLEGDKTILGRGLVVHAKEDDLKTQPTGNAGDRVAVGVIGVANPAPPAAK